MKSSRRRTTLDGRRRRGLLVAAALLAAIPFAGKADDAGPAGPGGPIVGSWPWIAGPEEVTRALADASNAAGHPVVLFVNPPHDSESAEENARNLAAASPGKTLIVVSIRDFDARIHPAASVRDQFPPALLGRMEHDLKVALTEQSALTTIARVVREVGETAAGRPPKEWIAWKHPYQVAAGGRDAHPLPLPTAIAFTFMFFAIVGGFLYALVTHPRAVLREIAEEVGGILIGGAIGSIGGGGGDGGGSFSGGGGSSGGGGAGGSW